MVIFFIIYCCIRVSCTASTSDQSVTVLTSVSMTKDLILQLPSQMPNLESGKFINKLILIRNFDELKSKEGTIEKPKF
jgi:hypothetical protein